MKDINLNRIIKDINLNRIMKDINLNRIIKDINLNRIIKDINLNRIMEDINLNIFYKYQHFKKYLYKILGLSLSLLLQSPEGLPYLILSTLLN